jgi:hypothetical protein
MLIDRKNSKSNEQRISSKAFEMKEKKPKN